MSKRCLVSYGIPYKRNIKIYLRHQDSKPNPVSINTYDMILDGGSKVCVHVYDSLPGTNANLQ